MDYPPLRIVPTRRCVLISPVVLFPACAGAYRFHTRARFLSKVGGIDHHCVVGLEVAFKVRLNGEREWKNLGAARGVHLVLKYPQLTTKFSVSSIAKIESFLAAIVQLHSDTRLKTCLPSDQREIASHHQMALTTSKIPCSNLPTR